MSNTTASKGNPKVSALDLLAATSSNAEVAPEAAQDSKRVVKPVSGSLLSQRKKRAPEVSKDGCASKTIRNLPQSTKDRYDRIVEKSLYDDTFNQYLLDAISDKLKNDEKVMLTEASLISRLVAANENGRSYEFYRMIETADLTLTPNTIGAAMNLIDVSPENVDLYRVALAAFLAKLELADKTFWSDDIHYGYEELKILLNGTAE